MMTWRGISVLILRAGAVAVVAPFLLGLALLVPTRPEPDQHRLL